MLKISAFPSPLFIDGARHQIELSVYLRTNLGGTLDILLVHTRGSVISWLIRKFTKSYWNHVGLFVSKDDQWPKWVIEALAGGIVGRPFELQYVKVLRDDDGRVLEISPSKKHHVAVVRVNGLTYEQRKEITNRAYHWALEERKYDYLLLIVGMLLHLISFRRWRLRWLNLKGRFICSELISVVFKDAAGMEFGKYTASGYVTPADIAVDAGKKEGVEVIMTNALKRS